MEITLRWAPLLLLPLSCLRGRILYSITTRMADRPTGVGSSCLCVFLFSFYGRRNEQADSKFSVRHLKSWNHQQQKKKSPRRRRRRRRRRSVGWLIGQSHGTSRVKTSWEWHWQISTRTTPRANGFFLPFFLFVLSCPQFECAHLQGDRCLQTSSSSLHGDELFLFFLPFKEYLRLIYNSDTRTKWGNLLHSLESPPRKKTCTQLC